MSSLIPSGWALSKINDTCDVFDSQRIPLNTQERALRKGHYPYYGANGVQGFIDDFIFDGEYVLLAEDGGYFEEFSSRPISYLVSGKFWVNNHAHILQAKKGHETKYIHYSLVHKNILKHINGGTRSKLNQSDMRDIEYLAPPLTEQQKIATILSSVDDVIEKTRTQIDKLKDLKTGMMQELLTKGIGHTEFKDSPVGLIPAKWDVKFLPDISENHDSKRVPIKSVDRANMKGGYRYYGASGIIDYVNDYIYDGTYILLGEDGENVLSRNLPLAFIVKGKFWVNNHAHVLKANPDTDINFLCEYLESIDYANIASGSAQPKITQTSLNSIQVPVPPLAEQKVIAAMLKSVDEKIQLTDKKLNQLRLSKKALMQDLLTGKVRVKLTDKESAAV